MRLRPAGIVVAFSLAAACGAGTHEPGAANTAGAAGTAEGGHAAEGGDTGRGAAGESSGAGPAAAGGGGQGGAESEPPMQLRFVNALFGCKSAQGPELDYELLPFDPYIVDVYVQGQAEPLFVGVPPAGAAAATDAIAFDDTLGAADEQELRFELRLAGSSPGSAALLVSDAVKASKLGPSATLVAMGDPGPNASAAQEHAVLLAIPRGETGQLGKPHLRFVAAGHQPQIDVRTGDSPQQKAERLGQYASTPGLGIELGTAPLRLAVLGPKTQPIFGGEASFSLAPAMLAHTRAALLVITGMGELRPADDPLGLSLLLVPEEPELPAIRVLQDPVIGFFNALHDPGSETGVDVWAGARSLASGLDYGAAPQFSSLSPYNTAPFRAQPSGTEPPLLKVEPPSLQAGKRYLGLLSGTTAADAERPPTLRFIAEEFALEPLRRRIRFIHAVLGVNSVEVGAWDRESGGPSAAFEPRLRPASYLQTGAAEGEPFLLPGEPDLGEAGSGFWGLRQPESAAVRISERSSLLREPSFLVIAGDWSDAAVDFFQIAPRQRGWRLHAGALSQR